MSYKYVKGGNKNNILRWQNYIRKMSETSTQNSLKTINTVGKGAQYKIKWQKSVAFLIRETQS